MGQLLDALPDRSNLSRRLRWSASGAGTMACYSEPGENWTFFEIDPTVVRIARNPDLFTLPARLQGQLRGDRWATAACRSKERPTAQLRPDRARRLQLRRDPDPPAHPRGGRAVRGQAAPGRRARLPRLEQVPRPGARARQRGARRGPRAATGRTTRPRAAAGSGSIPRTGWRWRRPARTSAACRATTRWQPCASDSGARAWTDDYANVVGAFD